VSILKLFVRDVLNSVI